jgi:hypothetical protein
MDRIITITNGDPNTGILTLSDQGTTNVSQGDQVTWVIGANSGVGSIAGVVEKPNSPDVFNPDPAQLPNSTSWQGTINPNIPNGTVEYYTINWTTVGSGWLNQGGGQTKSYDPKIAVNP